MQYIGRLKEKVYSSKDTPQINVLVLVYLLVYNKLNEISFTEQIKKNVVHTRHHIKNTVWPTLQVSSRCRRPCQDALV